jgi:AcrR family transcriptional regulator
VGWPLLTRSGQVGKRFAALLPFADMSEPADHTESAALIRSAKYDDIISAAQELFGEVGYDKTGVREIAERAHTALGTLYSYFPEGKIAVLTAALDQRVERLTAYAMQTAESSALDGFLDRVRRLNGEIVRDPFLRRLFVEGNRVTEPRLRELGLRIIDEFDAAAITELRRLIAQGLVKCDDPEAVVMLIRVANAGWISAQLSGSHTVEHERLLEILISSVRALIRPK